MRAGTTDKPESFSEGRRKARSFAEQESVEAEVVKVTVQSQRFKTEKPYE